MVNRNGLIIPVLIAAFFLSIGSFPCMASVSVGGMTFDSAVVNDNAGQATPANYSCTQSGSAITLSGQQPRTTANVTYFYNHVSEANEWKFMVGIIFPAFPIRIPWLESCIIQGNSFHR